MTYSHNYVGTTKRPVRILKMARNTERYRWRSRENGELARVIDVQQTRKDFRWFIIIQHEDGRKYMMPPRMFWLWYIKEEQFVSNDLCRGYTDNDG